MVNVDPRALWVANSFFNAAGIVAAASAWSSALDGKRRRLFWLVPIVLLSAWLETNLNLAYAGAFVMNVYRHMAVNVAAFSGLALVFVILRRRAAFSGARAATSETTGGAVAAKAISNPKLRQAVERLLTSADEGDVASLDEIYASDFSSV